jgi:uncharacterized protein (TIGR04206 family)
VAVVLASLSVPWTVVVYPGGVDFVFAWGLVNTNPLHLVPLSTYLLVYVDPAGLPPRLLAWPVATGLVGLAAASAALAAVGREDRRVTAGLLVLGALVHARLTLGFLRLGETVVPLGTGLLLGGAWWALGDGRTSDSDPRPRE